MDIRDFVFWSREANMRGLLSRMEAYTASLLPHQDGKVIKSKLDSIKWQVYDLDNEEDIEKIEVMAKKRLKEVKDELKKRRDKRKGEK